MNTFQGKATKKQTFSVCFLCLFVLLWPMLASASIGRITSRKLPGGQVEAMAYNIGGQLVGKSDFAGRITKYSYDQRGRLILKTPDASLSEPQVSFSYPNELTKVARRGSIANTYRYDPQRGWLDSLQSPNGLIKYSYDQTGNRTKVKITGKDNGVRETDYAYDELNRVDTVSRPGMGVLANYSYNAVGNVSNVARANGVLSAYGYDDLHRLTAIEHKKGAEVLSQFNYTLSADGKRNTLQEYLKYPAAQSVASVNRTVFYGYDNAGRLTGEQRQSTQALTAGGGNAKTSKTVWAYDKASNRLGQSVANYDGIGIETPATSTHNTGYQYNTNDWLTTSTSEYSSNGQATTSTTNYEYNDNGSQTAITSKVGETDQKRVPYFYDFEEKLVGIGAPADTSKHAYAYDAEGNRVTETNYNGPDTKTRQYLVDPQNSNAQVVEEYDEAGVLQAHYDWNDAELLRESALDDAGNFAAHAPLSDGHGSTRQLLNETSAVSDVYSFDAWGNAQENIGSSINPYRYNGQRLDTSGLYHLRARQYSTGTGRFLSHDPLMGGNNNPITQHRYLYAGADPANFSDPGGMEFSLAGSLSSMGVRGSIITGGGTAIRIGSSVAAAINAYNVYTTYRDTGEISVIDGISVLADAALSAAGGAILKRALSPTLKLLEPGGNAIAALANGVRGRILGQVASPELIQKVARQLDSWGVKLKFGGDDELGEHLAGFMYYPYGKAPEVIVREGATVYELVHEMFHALQYKSLGHKAFINMTHAAHEGFVFGQIMQHAAKMGLGAAELQHATRYINRVVSNEDMWKTPVEIWRSKGVKVG